MATLTQGQSYAGGTVNYDTATGKPLAQGQTTSYLPLITPESSINSLLVPNSLTPSSLLPTQPINVGTSPAPTVPDTTSTNTAIGTNAANLNGIDLFKQYTNSLTPPPSVSDQYNTDYANSGINTKQQGYNTENAALIESQGRLGALNAQLAGINANAQAIPIQMQQNAEGQGITAGGLAPLTAAALRKNALQAIPLQTQILGAQADVALHQGKTQLAQDILNQAQSHLDRVFQIHAQDAQNQYNYQKDLIDKAFAYATDQQKTQLAALQRANDQKFTTQQNELNNAQDLAKIATQNGQGNIAAQLTALDPSSPTYRQDIAKLEGQITDTSALVDLQLKQSTIAKNLSDAAKNAQLGADKAGQSQTLGLLLSTGGLPPSLVSAYGGSRNAAIVEADRIEMQRTGKHFDPAKAEIAYQAAKRFAVSLNGPQQVRYQALANSIVNSIDEATSLSDQMSLQGIPLVNKTKLLAYIQVTGADSPKGQLAAQYLTALNTVKEEFANLANGGYAPTDAAWALANQQINADYDVKKLQASLYEVQKLINYRTAAYSNISAIIPGQGSAKNTVVAPDGQEIIITD